MIPFSIRWRVVKFERWLKININEILMTILLGLSIAMFTALWCAFALNI
jgi:hypothetical protein